jgi:peptidoglycan LD-endopeptidase LytH
MIRVRFVNRLLFSASILLLILSVSCKQEKVSKEFKPTNAHEFYLYSLKQANLQNSVLYKRFVQASKDALTKALLIPIPYSEIFYIDHTNPDAYGYRFALKKGQKLKVKAELFTNDSISLFIDVFRIKDTANTSWYKVSSSSEDSLYLEFVVRRNAEYILRIQPELLCDVQCKVEIEIESSMLFPVLGQNKNSIQSFFGDPRDGGRRDHHGVDIFAARFTDVITSADGYITRTGNSKIGGRHVWTYYPSLGINCYYAHLETIDIKGRQKVKAGTKIGTVGNSGNAKYTPPHLHFGIYQSGLGPTDPYYFIATDNLKSGKIAERLEMYGNWAKTNSGKALLYSNNHVFELPSNSSLNICAINSTKFRVKLPDGRIGFIDINQIEVSDKTIIVGTNSKMANLYNTPDERALIVKDQIHIDQIDFLSIFNSYYFVRLSDGRTGWISSKEII